MSGDCEDIQACVLRQGHHNIQRLEHDFGRPGGCRKMFFSACPRCRDPTLLSFAKDMSRTFSGYGMMKSILLSCSGRQWVTSSLGWEGRLDLTFAEEGLSLQLSTGAQEAGHKASQHGSRGPAGVAIRRPLLSASKDTTRSCKLLGTAAFPGEAGD